MFGRMERVLLSMLDRADIPWAWAVADLERMCGLSPKDVLAVGTRDRNVHVAELFLFRARGVFPFAAARPSDIELLSRQEAPHAAVQALAGRESELGRYVRRPVTYYDLNMGSVTAARAMRPGYLGSPSLSR